MFYNNLRKGRMTKQCDKKACKNRHPEVCKWLEARNGFKRQNCDYLHVTLVHDDDQMNIAQEIYPCYWCSLPLPWECDSQHHMGSRAEYYVGDSVTFITNRSPVLAEQYCMASFLL